MNAANATYRDAVVARRRAAWKRRQRRDRRAIAVIAVLASIGAAVGLLFYALILLALFKYVGG